jgi:hypothetical protein
MQNSGHFGLISISLHIPVEFPDELLMEKRIKKIVPKIRSASEIALVNNPGFTVTIIKKPDRLFSKRFIVFNITELH